MQYMLGEFDICQIKSLLSVLDQVYSSHIADEIRQLLNRVVSNQSINDNEIYQLLDLLPKTMRSEFGVHSIKCKEEDEKEEWQNRRFSDDLKRQKILKQFQQRLVHLLFMQESVHIKNTRDRKISAIHNLVR